MNDVLFSRKSDEWSTPDNLFYELDHKYNFTLDPCANELNHKCFRYYSINVNGLNYSWKNETVFCNPPYSDIKRWVNKCYFENLDNNVEIVLLVPARTDTKWFHDYIYHNDRCDIEFIKGRLKFGGSYNSAPFPSMIVHFRKV